MARRRVVLSCGETSGDLHASAFVRALRRRAPDVEVTGLGGDRCREAGMRLEAHLRDVAVMGFAEVIRQAPRFWRLERRLRRLIDEGARLFVAVDYPGLNLRLANHARRRGVPVLYYVAPQVWAWGRWRLRRMARSVDRIACILPFEPPLFHSRGIPAEFVGHPLLERLDAGERVPDAERRGLGLFPGSRRGEVTRLLAPMVEAASRLRPILGDEPIAVGKAPNLSDSVYRPVLDSVDFPIALERTPELMRRVRAALVASGTATLELALHRTPMVVAYRTSWVNYGIARLLVRLRRIALVNIVSESDLCPELLQHRASGAALAAAVEPLLKDPRERERQVRGFDRLEERLRGGGGVERVVQMALELLEGER
jgi:lipid-A-disaccharide synthase